MSEPFSVYCDSCADDRKDTKDMKLIIVIATVIVIAAAAGILFASWKKRQAYASIYDVKNYGRGSRTVPYHPLRNLSDNELEWLMRFYDNEIRTRYHKTAGGMLVERPSPAQLQVERDLKDRRLSDDEIDELTLKLFDSMKRIERYDPERAQKMGDLREKLIQLKKGL